VEGDTLTNIWRGTERDGVALHLGHSASTLDPQHKRVIDDQGTVYTFDKLLLATGGTPRRRSFGAEQIIYFRTLADYRCLRGLADRGRRFAVIGGGFIGSEVAAALAMNGKEVVLLFPGDGIAGHMFPHPR
jgi:3-phenylpropionate/trans-cinnamate dioxygenase ferredoxin reductase subunit